MFETILTTRPSVTVTRKNDTSACAIVSRRMTGEVMLTSDV